MEPLEPSLEVLRDNGSALLFDSRNSIRLPVLQKISALLSTGKEFFETEELLTLQKLALLVFKTYNYYQDTQSRAAALRVVIAFVNFDSAYENFFVKSLHETSRHCANMAVTDVLSLLAWTNQIFAIVAANFESTQKGAELSAHPIFALLIDTQMALVYAATNSTSARVNLAHHTSHQKRVLTSSVTQTRYAITECLGKLSQPARLELIDFYMVKATSATVAVSEMALFLGVIADAVHEMVPTEPSLFDHVKKSPLNEKVVAFLTTNVLLGKTAPTPYSLATFSRYYLSNFVTPETFATHVLPDLEKAIMRSSEIGFCHLTPPLFSSKDCVDLSARFASSKLLVHILNGLKSAKEHVRQSAFTTLKLIFENALPSIDDKDVSKIIDEVFKTFKGTSMVESKILLANGFGVTRRDSELVTAKLLAVLLSLVSKEQNENVLQGLVHVFTQEYLLARTRGWSVGDDTKIFDQFKAGFEHPKLPLRSIWAACFGSVILDITNSAESDKLIKTLKSLYPALLKTLSDANRSPLLSVSNRGVIPAYVCIALTELIKPSESEASNVFHESLATQKDKFSILTSPQVFVKLTSAEQEWCSRALVSAFKYSAESVEYPFAYLHFAISNNVSHTVRNEAVDSIIKLMEVDETRASSMLVSAIYDVLSLDEKDNAEIDFQHNLRYLSPVFSRVSQIKNKKVATENLMHLIVAAHHPCIPIKESWIGLVLRANLDPGIIVKQHVSDIIESALLKLETAKLNGPLFKAALKTLSTVSFIDAKITQPEISRVLKSDLSVDNISDVDATAVEIWDAPEGELVVDVLKQTKPKRAEDKNSKDYETRKWEENLQKEISLKKAAPKKLTREEQALVNKQLSEESAARAKLNGVLRRYHRAFHIVHELCKGSNSLSEGGSEWFGVTVSELLKLLKHPYSFELFGEFAAETYIKASLVCRDRLHPLAEATGAVTLRLLGVRGIPENYTQLPLLQVLSTVLFRIKFKVDDWFHANGYIYITPLIIEVLNVGIAVALKNSKKQVVTSEFSDEDPEEEHLSLALSILSAQDMLQCEHVPREPILKAILALMKIPTKAKMAKECFSTLCQQISVNFTRADLSVLLASLLTPDTFVKTTVLQGIDAEFDLSDELSYSDEIWIMMHDNDEKAADLAKTIWEDSGFELVEDALERLLQFVDDADTGMRLTVAKSIASAVEILSEKDSNIYQKALDALLSLYRVKENPPAPQKDQFGLVIKNNSVLKDTWEPRSTIAIALRLLSPLCKTQNEVEQIFRFLVSEEALADKEPLVAQELLEAGTEVVKVCGANFVEILVPIFEECLNQSDRGSKRQDRIKESVIILYGSLGQYLDAEDQRLAAIFARLLKTLDTPSEDVQYAVAECIAPLVNSMAGSLQDRFDELFEKLWHGSSLAIRKGSAYGIAGLVKGAGIRSLFENDIIRTLSDAFEDKKNTHAREGVSCVLECLSQFLGAKYEPYVAEVVPLLLQSLSDPRSEVREATDLASKQIMRATTSYGVKRLIPLALEHLQGSAWRSKKGAVELLGTMAYLDPAQLSSSLAVIIPEIVGILADSHKEVRRAGDEALKRFGEVIRNPEIRAAVPELLRAIGDPKKHTDAALDALLATQFSHYIDGPSLALLSHVVGRGLRERSAQTKRKACQVVGNMAVLVAANDLVPYVPSLVSDLESAMVDPVPETRSTAARALGSLVERLGEHRVPQLLPKLVATLNDPTRVGDRLGSAQALAEVVCGLGVAKLDEILPEILTSAQSDKAHVRAGFMPLLVYLPVCFGAQFSPYLARIVPPILHGLADTDEEIRGTALNAGRLLVRNYASKAVELLLPELEIGLADTDPRIRLSSLELAGDLLFQVTGISSVVVDRNEDEETEESYKDSRLDPGRNLISTLGQERRDRVLAAIYVCRSDTYSPVRAAAADVWKALVANTPKTVREIIATLAHTLVVRLGSQDESQRTIAALALGDVVRRAGASVLTSLVPALEEVLLSNDSHAKQGVCVAVSELTRAASAESVETFHAEFVGITRDALIDANEEVRTAAAGAFEALYEQFGRVVVDEVVPHLLKLVGNAKEDVVGSVDVTSDVALHALKDLMATNAAAIFPISVSALLTPPFDAAKATALASLASVAGPVYYSRLTQIISALLVAVVETAEFGTPEELEQVQSAFDTALLAAASDECVHSLMQQLMAMVKHSDPAKRAAICSRLAVFFKNTSLDYSVYVPDLVGQLIFYLGDGDARVVVGVFEALSALVAAQEKHVLEQLVKPAHQALLLSGVHGEDLPGFSLPKGPSCILPIFSHGLMYGNSEQKELSALAIAELVARTPAASLRPFATPLTGPLIRVVGEKVSPNIKTAILAALTSLLRRIPQFLRPFVPQLQRTFVRSLSDASNEKLRSAAIDALALLVGFQPRVDSLVTELVVGAKTADDQGVKNSLLKAMLQVVLKGGKNMGEASKTSIMALVEEELGAVTDKSAVAYARLLGSLSQILSSVEAANILKNKVLSKRGDDEAAMKFAILSINSFLRDAPVHVFETGLVEEISGFVVECANSQSPYISDNATVAIGKLALLHGETKSPKQEAAATGSIFEVPESLRLVLIESLCKNALGPQSGSSDTRRLALVAIRTVARFKFDSFVQPFFDTLVPSVFACLRDAVIPIRLASEKAYLAVLNLVQDTEQSAFSQWFENASKSEITTIMGAAIQPRSIGDYTKRVASRLASVERERLEDGGDDETMFSDRYEDENEVWAVGGF